MTVRIAVPEFVMVEGLIDAVNPVEGVTVRDTTPENPLMDPTVTVDVAEEPGELVRLVGLALIVKSAPEDMTLTPRAIV